MKYTIKYSGLFKRSFKRCMRRGYDEQKFREVVTLLATDGTLPQKYNPHPLTGNYKGCMECHITPDWLLVWEQHDNELILLLVDTGTHADLFGKKRK